jgi:hypothetical protein
MDTSGHISQPQPEELLISYVDGELPIEQEHQLFAHLAANTNDVRSVMREMLAIRAAVQSDTEAFTPPPMATAGIFSTLGMNAPAQNAALPAAAEILRQGGPSIWQRFMLPAFTMAIGAFLGCAYMYLRHQDESREWSEMLHAYRSSATAGSRLNGSIMTTGGIVPATPIIIEKQGPVRIIYRNNPAAPAILNSNNGSISTAVQNPDEQIIRSQSLSAPNNAEQSNKQSTIAASALLENPAQMMAGTDYSLNTRAALADKPLDMLQETYPQFWAQIRSMAPVISSASAVESVPSSFSDNIRLTLAYSFNEHLALGIEGGRETYNLQYSGIKSERLTQFSQVSPMLTGGIMMQGRTGTLDWLGGQTRLYANGFAGASEIGYIGRVGAGIVYPVTSNFALTAGIEQSWLNYKFQGNWFGTRKFDIIYGLNITF